MTEDEQRKSNEERRNRLLADIVHECKEQLPKAQVSKVTWDSYTGWVVEFTP